MDFCWHGGILVFVGTISLAIGGLIATYGWDVWSHQCDRTKLLRKGMWDITRGTIIVALGGLLATLGWNGISLGQQKKHIIKAVVQEWAVNNVDLKRLTGPVYYSEDGQKRGIRLFPQFGTTALDAVVTSGYFSMSGDKEILMAALNYKRALCLANGIFGRFNGHLLEITGPDKLERRVAQAKEYRSMISSSPWGKNLLEQHYGEMQGLLKNKYEWAMKEQIGVDPEQEEAQSHGAAGGKQVGEAR